MFCFSYWSTSSLYEVHTVTELTAFFSIAICLICSGILGGFIFGAYRNVLDGSAQGLPPFFSLLVESSFSQVGDVYLDIPESFWHKKSDKRKTWIGSKFGILDIISCDFWFATNFSFSQNQKEDFFVQLAFRYSSTQLDDLAGWPVAVPAVTLPLPPAVGTFQVPGFFKGGRSAKR